MPYYLRKIDKALWLKTDPLTSDVAADAITNCLSTKNNSISVWKVDDLSAQTLQDIVVAIASSFTSGVDTFDVVVLDEAEITGLSKTQVDSPTPFQKAAKLHHDIVGLTISSLNHLSQVIYPKFSSGRVLRFTKGQIKDFLRIEVRNDNSLADRMHISITSSLKL